MVMMIVMMIMMMMMCVCVCVCARARARARARVHEPMCASWCFLDLRKFPCVVLTLICKLEDVFTK